MMNECVRKNIAHKALQSREATSFSGPSFLIKQNPGRDRVGSV